MFEALLSIEKQLVAAAWKPNVILGINRGGCVPGVYLSHKMNILHQVIDVRLRDHKMPPDLSVLKNAIKRNEKILIIDDINDTGATFNYILDHFDKVNGNIRFAVLIENVQRAVTVDYHGSEIDKALNPQWIVFPWEEWNSQL